MDMSDFKLTDGFLDGYEGKQPDWGFGGLGWVVYKRTYARPRNAMNLSEGYEDWWETVRRVVEGVYRVQQAHCDKNALPWSPQKAQASAQKMYDLIFQMKFLPPGRGLWAMGTEYVERRGSAALNNCAFTSTEDIKRDFSYPFTFLMDMSMLGVGVGGDAKGAGTVTLKPPSMTDEPYIVRDSREGWVESVRTILDAFVGKGKLSTNIDYSEVRPEGSPLRGFGGVASGPEPLRFLHLQLIALMTESVGAPITSTTIVDIFNMIGRCVVAGGIRRSAEIMIGDPDDDDFINLKNHEMWPEEMKSHRWASNNSLFGEVGMDYSKFVDQIASNGEPGFFWIDNARKFRRMKDGEGNWDPHVMGSNPCGEIALESGEFCNLVEVFPFKHDSYADFQNTLKFAYLFAKSVSLMPTHNPNTNAIIGRNRRLGVSVSGVVQGMEKFGIRPFFKALDNGYGYLRGLDAKYSKWLCVPESIKLTTVKPSGTISLLAGSNPGVHFPHSEYYIRNVRFDPHSPLLPVLTKAGYPIEESVAKDNTLVVSFPVHEKLFRKGKADATIWEQFEIAAQMQHYWSDNMVSVTATFSEAEKDSLATVLSMYDTSLKSVSLLPLDVSSYEQAPYIAIDKEKYDEMISGIKRINFKQGFKGEEVHDTDEKFCEGDTCVIL
jgi:hypothetical protein